jgi:hypothetical protein
MEIDQVARFVVSESMPFDMALRVLECAINDLQWFTRYNPVNHEIYVSGQNLLWNGDRVYAEVDEISRMFPRLPVIRLDATQEFTHKRFSDITVQMDDDAIHSFLDGWPSSRIVLDYSRIIRSNSA